MNIRVIFAIDNIEFNIELAKDSNKLKFYLVCLGLIGQQYKSYLTPIKDNIFTVDSIDLTYWYQITRNKLSLNKLPKPIVKLDIPATIHEIKAIRFEYYNGTEIIETIDIE
jgi:hypothetical protein